MEERDCVKTRPQSGMEQHGHSAGQHWYPQNTHTPTDTDTGHVVHKAKCKCVCKKITLYEVFLFTMVASDIL